MLARSLAKPCPQPPVDLSPGGQKWKRPLTLAGAFILGRLLGSADERAVAAMAARELSLILRSRAWHRFTGMWLLTAAALLIAPILYRCQAGGWNAPSNAFWFGAVGYSLQVALALSMSQWTLRRLRRDLNTARIDELLLTRCSPADIAMAEALASAVASGWLVLVTLPICLLLSAMVGQGFSTALRLALTLAPAAGLGVWFGLGWGLAFTLRRSTSSGALTEWWVKVPMVPIWAIWCLLGSFPVIWASLELIPGGHVVVQAGALALRWLLIEITQHWNPLLAIAAAAKIGHTNWFTDWLVLVLFLFFMMRKSVDAVQSALSRLGEREMRNPDVVYWVHHDAQYFTQYAGKDRAEPRYRDAGNPVAAFDVARGHRVFLHPFLWTVGLLAYLFLLGWSMLVPPLGKITGIAAVLIPATGALLFMSGGVAVSFGWERDQNRWIELAVLPIDNRRLALGKLKGVIRPTLWIGLMAALTATLLGWRGVLDWHASLWMAIHVLLFPVVLAVVSATLALTTPTVGEALYRWAVLGAIPTLATVLPPPIGGGGGIAAPFSPPVMVLFLVLNRPSPELFRGAWISLILELIGLIGSLCLLTVCLRGWTVANAD